MRTNTSAFVQFTTVLNGTPLYLLNPAVYTDIGVFVEALNSKMDDEVHTGPLRGLLDHGPAFLKSSAGHVDLAQLNPLTDVMEVLPLLDGCQVHVRQDHDGSLYTLSLADGVYSAGQVAAATNVPPRRQDVAQPPMM